jgi:hypothetical protein
MAPLDPELRITLDLDSIDRWAAFARLQELSIDCACNCGQPLQVTVTTPAAAIQIWSVARSITASREAAIASLEHCWNQVAFR